MFYLVECKIVWLCGEKMTTYTSNIKKIRLTPEELARKRNAIGEIRSLMLKCYPDAGSKKTREHILARVSNIFVTEFGNQKDVIRNQIIGRLFNRDGGEKMVLDINGLKTEFKILKYAKLCRVDGIPVEQLKNSSLPKHFREGMMASLFKREIDKRMQSEKMFKRPVIDITQRQSRKPANIFSSVINAGWFGKFSCFL